MILALLALIRGEAGGSECTVPYKKMCTFLAKKKKNLILRGEMLLLSTLLCVNISDKEDGEEWISENTEEKKLQDSSYLKPLLPHH